MRKSKTNARDSGKALICNQNKWEKDAIDELETFLHSSRMPCVRMRYVNVDSVNGKRKREKQTLEINRANERAQLTKIYDWIFVSIWHVLGNWTFYVPRSTLGRSMLNAIVFIQWNYTYNIHSNLNTFEIARALVKNKKKGGRAERRKLKRVRDVAVRCFTSVLWIQFSDGVFPVAWAINVHK